MPRCPWATTEPNIAYHDEEWGVPVHNDRLLFEFLILEGAQAGLSWTTILKKRGQLPEGVLIDFIRKKIARYGARDVKRLLANAGIVRKPIENRGRDRETRRCFSRRAQRIWEFRCLPMELRRGQNRSRIAGDAMSDVPARTAESDAMSRDPRPTRVQIRWLNDLLRVDASDWHGQRSSRHMSAIRRGQQTAPRR